MSHGLPSSDIYEFIKFWESPGGKPVLQRYQDAGGKWTIGHGHLLLPGEEYTTIDAELAELLFKEDVLKAAIGVEKSLCGALVTQNEFDALVSIAFNVGADALTTSTLMRRVREGNPFAASEEFPKWVRAGGRIVPGLQKRRNAERAIFDNADYSGRP